jgi:hypothetical protein
VVAYLRAWKRADARDEAYVRGGLAPSSSSSSSSSWDGVGDVKDAWECRAEAAGQRARCRTLGLTSEWLQSESSSDDDDE